MLGCFLLMGVVSFPQTKKQTADALEKKRSLFFFFTYLDVLGPVVTEWKKKSKGICKKIIRTQKTLSRDPRRVTVSKIQYLVVAVVYNDSSLFNFAYITLKPITISLFN